MRAGFDGLLDQVGELFAEQRYTEAYTLLTTEGAAYPDRAQVCYYLRSCSAARMGDADLAVAVIREALDDGHWFGEFLVRRTPSWRSLQGMAAFEDVAAASIERARAAAIPAYHRTSLPTDARPPYRAVIALHGNTQNSEAAATGWRALTEMGRLLAAVQSSQVIGPGERAVWLDMDDSREDFSRADVVGRFEALTGEHELDADRTILAGFSMGAETALRLALTGALPVRGFILLGPGGPRTPDPDSWMPLVEQWKASGAAPLRGFLMVGEDDDEVPADTHRRLAQTLTDHGISCGFEVIPGLDHEYPADFLPFLQRALEFVDPDG